MFPQPPPDPLTVNPAASATLLSVRVPVNLTTVTPGSEAFHHEVVDARRVDLLAREIERARQLHYWDVIGAREGDGPLDAQVIRYVRAGYIAEALNINETDLPKGRR